VSYATQLQYSHLSPEAVHAAKRSLIDSIACAIGARNSEAIQGIIGLASEVSSKRPANILGTDIATSAEMAGFANGCMIRYLDFSDDYFGGNGALGPHPSDNVGSIIAAAQSEGLGGKDLILGITLAYEIVGRIIDDLILDPGDNAHDRSWDYPIFHSMATAVAVGKIFGLASSELHHALSLAIVPNVPLRQTRSGQLSNWKGFAGPNGSRGGLFAALLARAGIAGPDLPFEGKLGLFRHLGCSFKLDHLRIGEGPFRVERTFLKFKPVRYSTQLSVSIALALHKRIEPRDIESIDVFVVDRYVTDRSLQPEYWNPTTRETADHSPAYLSAVCLIDGLLTDRSFTPARFRDPQVLELVQKIRYFHDPYYTSVFPGEFNVRFEVTLKSGHLVSLHESNPRGHPDNPMTDREIEEKFAELAEDTLAPKRQRTLLDQLWNVDKLDRLDELFPLMLPG
jgi:2-methylcitrate dehydratase